jgi:hypothetical protein
MMWRIDAASPVLVRVSRYYKVEDLSRTCRIASGLSRVVPEAVAPLVGPGGEAAFDWDGLA